MLYETFILVYSHDPLPISIIALKNSMVTTVVAAKKTTALQPPEKADWIWSSSHSLISKTWLSLFNLYHTFLENPIHRVFSLLDLTWSLLYKKYLICRAFVENNTQHVMQSCQIILSKMPCFEQKLEDSKR